MITYVVVGAVCVGMGFTWTSQRNQDAITVERYTVKLGNKERFDKEQIGIKEPFPVTNLPFTS